ncbi:hypothetical protein [Streptomyces sp. NPDC053367]|uniref:hypothetical protein n=1 Tax=Streptomyces sp. NPDC053367 TaxID=3365700 RepID=UPI0037D16B1A
MRRSTPWTRGWGAAALVSAAAAVLLPFLRYGAPVPRWDVMAAAAVSLVSGLGWVAATWRAPLVAAARPLDDGPVPGVIPRRPLSSLGRGLAVTVGAYALVAAQLLAWQPDGAQGRTLAAIQDAGARVSHGRITAVTADEKTHVGVSGRKFGAYHYASLTVELPDGTRLAVDRGIVAGAPYAYDEVDVLHAPGHPELGGWVDDSTDVTAYVHTWRPPFAFGPFFLSLVVVVTVFAAAEGSRLSGRGARRLLREDAARGRVHAVRVTGLTAVHGEHRTVGSRAGSTRTEVRRSLEAATANGTVQLFVPRDDIEPLVKEFGAGGGRLLFARRWEMTDEKQAVPGVYAAPDGRVFRFTALRSDVRSLTAGGVVAFAGTDPSVTARDWEGACTTTPRGRLALVVVYAAAAASTVPVLTGTASHLTGCLPVAALAAAPLLALWLGRTTGVDPVWHRRTTTDPRVRSAQAR